jgi:hypothetical protein
MRGRGHIFEDLHKLNEMIAMRQQGIGPSKLAVRFGVDHSTIIYHCKRNGVVVPKGRRLELATLSPIVVTERPKRVSISIKGFAFITDETGDRINPGKNYADYVAERQKREEVRNLQRLGAASSVFINHIRITSIASNL